MALIGRGAPIVLFASVVLFGCGSRAVDAVEVDPLYGARVAAWSFDETSGQIAHDGLAQHYDGVVVGGEWIPDGHLGGALRLRPGHWMRVDRSTVAGGDFSVSVWVRLSLRDVGRGRRTALLSTEVWPNGGPAPLTPSGDVVPSGGWELSTESMPSGAFDFALSGVIDPGLEGRKMIRCCQLELERWYHLVGVFDATTRTMSLYEGGLLQDRRSLPTPVLAGDASLYVGRSYIDSEARGADRMWSGVVDDLTIYDRALGDDDVRRLESNAASLATARRE